MEAFQSLILDGVLPVSEKSSLHSSAIVQGFGGGFVNAPLHNVTLKSALVSDNVVVGVCSHIPIKGVSFILGNDLAGGRVLATPEVIPIPAVSEVPNELAQKHPGVFPVCAVTRAMSKNDKSDSHVVDDSNCDITLSDTFVVELKSDHVERFGKVLPSHEQLVLEQNKDVSLSSLFEEAVSEDAIVDVSHGYFVSNSVLRRKWTPPNLSNQDDWGSVFQVVVPAEYRPEILHLAHDHCQLWGQTMLSWVYVLISP